MTKWFESQLSCFLALTPASLTRVSVTFSAMQEVLTFYPASMVLESSQTQLLDITQHSFLHASYFATKEQLGLQISEGERLNGLKLLLWHEGRTLCLVWNLSGQN